MLPIKVGDIQYKSGQAVISLAASPPKLCLHANNTASRAMQANQILDMKSLKHANTFSYTDFKENARFLNCFFQ